MGYKCSSFLASGVVESNSGVQFRTQRTGNRVRDFQCQKRKKGGFLLRFEFSFWLLDSCAIFMQCVENRYLNECAFLLQVCKAHKDERGTYKPVY